MIVNNATIRHKKILFFFPRLFKRTQMAFGISYIALRISYITLGTSYIAFGMSYITFGMSYIDFGTSQKQSGTSQNQSGKRKTLKLACFHCLPAGAGKFVGQFGKLSYGLITETSQVLKTFEVLINYFISSSFFVAVNSPACKR